MVLIQTEPYLMINDDGSFSGYMVDLMDEVARRLNFKYEFHLSPDGKYGSPQRDGTWNGMVGELVKGVHIRLVLI